MLLSKMIGCRDRVIISWISLGQERDRASCSLVRATVRLLALRGLAGLRIGSARGVDSINNNLIL
jgi:hypothetical protein